MADLKLSLTLVESGADLEPALEVAQFAHRVQPLGLEPGWATQAFEVFEAGFTAAVERWDAPKPSARMAVLKELAGRLDELDQLGLSVHQGIARVRTGDHLLPLAILTVGIDPSPTLALSLDDRFELAADPPTRH